MNIYSIYDSKAEFYLPIFLANTDSEAQRMFIGSLGDSFRFRHDYSLFCLGTFDRDSGTIETMTGMCIMNGAQIPERFNPQPTMDEIPFPTEGDNFKNLNAKDAKQ